MFFAALVIFGLWALGGPAILAGLAWAQARRHRGSAAVLMASAVLIALTIWLVGPLKWGQEWLGPSSGLWLVLLSYGANWVSLVWRGVVNKRLGRTATFPVVDTRLEQVLVKLLYTVLALLPLALLVLKSWADLISAI